MGSGRAHDAGSTGVAAHGHVVVMIDELLVTVHCTVPLNPKSPMSEGEGRQGAST